MTITDFVVFLLYITGVVFVGVFMSTKIKNSGDFFAAGRQSPWWMAGISSFMTMFSSATFVVWGGIAFKQGAVAVLIMMCLGISAVLVGFNLADKWRKTGVTTAAEYINKRFGKSTFQFYTWFNIVYRLLSMAVALYSLGVILSALIPISNARFFHNQNLEFISVNWIIIFSGAVIIAYTVLGGLWAVLLNDALQFIVLIVAVSMVVPLGLQEIGGISAFISNSPDNFFSPTTKEFGWIFLCAWIIIHYFKIGGEWAFIQRFVSVPKPGDAKKAAYLFGVIFMISPLLWMLPPMMYRFIDPTADPEQAYILACQEFLPNGIVGLVIAAMFAATASMIDSEINVFSGVFTRDIFYKLFPSWGEKTLVKTGRIITIVIGILVVILSILVPKMGGAEEIVLSVTALITAPLLMPVIWGLFFAKIEQNQVFITIFTSVIIVVLLKFGFLIDNAWFLKSLNGEFKIWMQQNTRAIETISGLIVPLFILSIIEKNKKSLSGKYISFDKENIPEKEDSLPAVLFPAKIIAVSIAFLSTIILVSSLFSGNGKMLLFIFSISLYAISFSIIYLKKRQEKNNMKYNKTRNNEEN